MDSLKIISESSILTWMTFIPLIGMALVLLSGPRTGPAEPSTASAPGVEGALPGVPEPAPPVDGREALAVVLVNVAHFLSHFYQFVLPPVFALMAVRLDIGFTELGLAITVFSISLLCYVVSDLDSPFSGFFTIDVSTLHLLLHRVKSMHDSCVQGINIVVPYPQPQHVVI